MEQEKKAGQFNSNFGFLMACLGSAVGLGNLWSFPYKLGTAGGFAFLLVYVVLCVVVGYPLILSEVALGRKSQKAAVEAYASVKPAFKFNGVLQTAVPFLLICFYCTFGGYITKYLVASTAGLFSANATLNTVDPTEYFAQSLLSNGTAALPWMIAYLALTFIIILGGVSGGIEKFCKYAMPALFIMLVIIVIRSCTLPGAGAGLSFLFKPDFSVFSTPQGIFDTFKFAGGQMFFSLSLSSGCLIAYGSYLSQDENLEKDSVFIAVGDSLVAVLAGMAIMPAVFSFGLEAGAGPSLLFVTMTTVFQSLGFTGRILAFLFWLLVFFAALSSSIGMMQAGIAALLDAQIKAGKNPNTLLMSGIMTIVALVGNTMTTLDCLGAAPTMQWFHILGQADVLSVWDAIAEGILMPLTGLIMAILLGWVAPHYIDDEVMKGSQFKSKGLYNVCIKYVGPVFMALIVYSQITTFFVK